MNGRIVDAIMVEAHPPRLTQAVTGDGLPEG